MTGAAEAASSRPLLPEGPFLVCGLARSGQALCKALRQRGETVIAVDAAAPDGAAGLSELGVEVHLDASGEDLIGRVKVLVKSPGVPQTAPVVVAARAAGIAVVGELDLGWRLAPGRVIAVTGTNGKTTVTEMIGHILRESGRPVEVVGNVGRPVSELAVAADSSDRDLVIEASSFQLEDSELFAPNVGVLLNVTPDHLDRHGTMAEYRAAKLRLFANQTEADVAVLPADLRDLSARSRVVTFGAADADVCVENGAVSFDDTELVGQGQLRLPGGHNLLNAAAAAAACIAHGVDQALIGSALRSFPGVPHRLELVAEAAGVSWFNDSKSTNVDSTITALAAIEAPVHLILGGEAKGQDFSSLTKPISARCASVHLIGVDAGRIAEALSGTAVSVFHSGELVTAVAEIADQAVAGDVALLSPACASFDQFSDFEDRGRRFTALAREVVR